MRFINVYGAPCSGKSTYVEKHAGPKDIIYDYDKLAHALTANSMHENNPALVDYLVDFRSLLISKLASRRDFEVAWIISTYPLKNFPVGVSHELVHIEASMDVCLARASERPNPELTASIIRKYFRASKNPFKGSGRNEYKTYRWQKLRQAVIKRDNNECQQCKDKGLVSPGEVVHHIKPAETHPHLFFKADNLQTLCRYHHEQLHGRTAQQELQGRFPESWT